MHNHRRTSAAVVVALGFACASAAADLKITPLTATPRVGELCEFRLAAPTKGGNPYDPRSMALDAAVALPGGKTLRTPGFYIVPHRQRTAPPPGRVCRLFRVFLPTAAFQAGRKVAFLLDDIRLVDARTGKVTVFDDFEGRGRFEASGLKLSLEGDRAHGGRRALRAELVVPKKRGWPGVNWNVDNQDWRHVSEVRLRVMPLEGLDPGMPMIEFWTPENEKFQGHLDLAGKAEGKWHEVVWQVPRPRERVRFEPTGGGEWRVRLMPLSAGEHKATFTFRGPGGRQTGEYAFTVVEGKADGFVRVSRADPRYLAYQSGRGYLPVGMNLLGRDLAHYRYYLDILAANGCNFVRVWLSPRTMGFERRLGRYEQDRAAQLDALLWDCRRRGIRLMVCITDFREVCSFHEQGHWDESPYNAANGGPAKRPEEFFTDPAAAEMYRRKLRYLVARYGADPFIMSWEFLNEVNITDGWRKKPAAVREWHAQMAAYLAQLDPYGRPITSSFAGVPDDALWTQRGMQIVQKHLYLRPGLSFVPTSVEATRLLARHDKPVLIGEFGRSNKVSPRYDAEGIGLHNGLWASVTAGGCGTAMVWWWQWLDRYDQWRHFSAIARFLGGIDFPREGFSALEGTAAAELAAGQTLPPARIVPHKMSWKPAPYNQPRSFRLDDRGRIDRPELLSGILHGKRNHPKLHNPVTFAATFVRRGRFTVAVQEVSKYGGAAMRIEVDGHAALEKDFPYADDPKQPTRPYAGTYAVDVPAGRHEIAVVCTGNDWIRVRAYEFDGVKSSPPLTLLGLRGRGTVLAWLWNGTHLWGPAATGWKAARLANVRVELSRLPPGRWRVRPYDPWAGKWGKDRGAAVAADGRLRLNLDRLDRDFAWRLERADHKGH